MNEYEENKYLEIKDELLNNEVKKKVSNYVVNRNELERYYNVGKIIIEAQGGEEKAKYGDGLIKKYSKRLMVEINKKYSYRNLMYMRKFYILFRNKKVNTVCSQLTWSHYRELLKFNDFNEIEYYINIILNKKLSVRELQNSIKNKDYQRLPIETKTKLINNENNKIDDFIKNPIVINTYGNTKLDITEKMLKEYILHDMKNFLNELGNGFSYIADEYKIKIGDKYNYIDLLLFNYIYNAFVVVELKVTKSNKNHLGQIGVYMNYIDKHVKSINQDKTIGIIVCRRDDKYLIEYSSDKRIKITSYELV